MRWLAGPWFAGPWFAGPWFERVAFPLLILGAGAGYFLPPVNVDEGAIFDFAARMLAGQVLYVDLIDVNPPLIFLLNLLPAALAQTTALAVPAIIAGCVLALPVLSRRALLRFAGLPSARAWVTGAIAVALVYLLILYPGAEFSQREHLILLATIPYLYNLHAGLSDGPRRRLAVRLGEIAPFAVLVCLKPHFALVPLCLEGYAWWRIARSRGRLAWRHETLALLAIGAAVWIATLVFFPAYLERILPLAARRYGVADPGLLVDGFFGSEGRRLLAALLLAAALYGLALRRLWLLLLLIAAAGFYLEAALQLKDWAYHFLPARALVLLGLFAGAAVLLAEGLEHGRRRAGRSAAGRSAASRSAASRSAAGLALAALLVGIGLPELSDPDPQSSLPLPYPAQRGFATDGWRAVREIVADHARGQSVMWLSQYNDGSARALAYAHARLVAPTMSLWMLPAIYQAHEVRDGKVVFHDPASMPPDERWLWSAVSDAFFTTAPPVLVVVKDDPGLQPGRFDYVDYFSTNPRFRARLAAYRAVYENDVARVYVRMQPAQLIARAH